MRVSKRTRVFVLITIGALVLVAVAIAGNGRITGASALFSPGGTTGSGTTTLASVEASAVTATEPTFTVSWQGRSFHTGNVIKAEVKTWVKGVCVNAGGQLPSDPNNQKSSTAAADVTAEQPATVSSNGNSSGSVVVTITADTYSKGLTCQGNQAAVLYSLWGVPPSKTPGPPSITLKLYSDGTSTATLLDTAVVTPPSNTPYCRAPGAADCFT